MPTHFNRVAARFRDSLDEFIERMEDGKAGRRDKYGRRTQLWHDYEYQRQRRARRHKSKQEEAERLERIKHDSEDEEEEEEPRMSGALGSEDGSTAVESTRRGEETRVGGTFSGTTWRESGGGTRSSRAGTNRGTGDRGGQSIGTYNQAGESRRNGNREEESQPVERRREGPEGPVTTINGQRTRVPHSISSNTTTQNTNARSRSGGTTGQNSTISSAEAGSTNAGTRSQRRLRSDSERGENRHDSRQGSRQHLYHIHESNDADVSTASSSMGFKTSHVSAFAKPDEHEDPLPATVDQEAQKSRVRFSGINYSPSSSKVTQPPIPEEAEPNEGFLDAQQHKEPTSDDFNPQTSEQPRSETQGYKESALAGQMHSLLVETMAEKSKQDESGLEESSNQETISDVQQHEGLTPEQLETERQDTSKTVAFVSKEASLNGQTHENLAEPVSEGSNGSTPVSREPMCDKSEENAEQHEKCLSGGEESHDREDSETETQDLEKHLSEASEAKEQEREETDDKETPQKRARDEEPELKGQEDKRLEQRMPEDQIYDKIEIAKPEYSEARVETLRGEESGPEDYEDGQVKVEEPRFEGSAPEAHEPEYSGPDNPEQEVLKGEESRKGDSQAKAINTAIIERGESKQEHKQANSTSNVSEQTEYDEEVPTVGPRTEELVAAESRLKITEPGRLRQQGVDHETVNIESLKSEGPELAGSGPMEPKQQAVTQELEQKGTNILEPDTETFEQKNLQQAQFEPDDSNQEGFKLEVLSQEVMPDDSNQDKTQNTRDEPEVQQQEDATMAKSNNQTFKSKKMELTHFTSETPDRGEDQVLAQAESRQEEPQIQDLVSAVDKESHTAKYDVVHSPKSTQESQPQDLAPNIPSSSALPNKNRGLSDDVSSLYSIADAEEQYHSNISSMSSLESMRTHVHRVLEKKTGQKATSAESSEGESISESEEDDSEDEISDIEDDSEEDLNSLKSRETKMHSTELPIPSGIRGGGSSPGIEGVDRGTEPDELEYNEHEDFDDEYKIDESGDEDIHVNDKKSTTIPERERRAYCGLNSENVSAEESSQSDDQDEIPRAFTRRSTIYSRVRGEKYSMARSDDDVTSDAFRRESRTYVGTGGERYSTARSSEADIDDSDPGFAKASRSKGKACNDRNKKKPAAENTKKKSRGTKVYPIIVFDGMKAVMLTCFQSRSPNRACLAAIARRTKATDLRLRRRPNSNLVRVNSHTDSVTDHSVITQAVGNQRLSMSQPQDLENQIQTPGTKRAKCRDHRTRLGSEEVNHSRAAPGSRS
ncbi:MAG: hypothetical protein Q9190_003185 [Brigantiaea leucoxantha]